MKGHPWAGCAVSVPCFKCRQQPDMFVGSLQRGECSSSQLAQAKGKAAEELKGVLGGQHDHPESPHTAHQRGEKPFNRLALMQHGQGFRTEPAQREGEQKTHAQSQARAQRCDTRMHTSLSLFPIFFFLYFFSFAELARRVGAEPGKTNQPYHPIQEVSL